MLYSRAFQVEGAVPEPMKLVCVPVHQPTASMSVDDLVLNKYERLFSGHSQEGTQNRRHCSNRSAIEMWRRYGTVQAATPKGRMSISTGSPVFHRLIRSMAAKDSKFRDDLIKQFDKNVEMMKTARGLSPFDANFRRLNRRVDIGGSEVRVSSRSNRNARTGQEAHEPSASKSEARRNSFPRK